MASCCASLACRAQKMPWSHGQLRGSGLESGAGVWGLRIESLVLGAPAPWLQGPGGGNRAAFAPARARFSFLHCPPLVLCKLPRDGVRSCPPGPSCPVLVGLSHWERDVSNQEARAPGARFTHWVPFISPSPTAGPFSRPRSLQFVQLVFRLCLFYRLGTEV